RADLEPRVGHQLEDEGSLRAFLFPLARASLPSSPSAPTTPGPLASLADAGGSCFSVAPARAGAAIRPSSHHAASASAEATKRGLMASRPLAIPPPRAIFPMMMVSVPPSDLIRAMADKDEDTPGTPGVGIATRTRAKPKKPSMYKVLLLNDDYTPMEFVVMVLQRFFNMDIERATQVMLHVHQQGVGVCGVFSYEVRSE